MLKKVETALEWGGTRKDIAFLAVSAVALIASFIWENALPVDPAWVAIALCGVPIVVEAAIALITEHDVKADLLVSLALIAAVSIGEFFAAGEVALIMQLGGLLEELTVARARSGIERLVEMTPTQARVIGEAGAESLVPVENIDAGSSVRVLPGETIPVDGVIVQGVTSVNEAVMTGESMPVDKRVGDEVCSGTVNQFGAIDVRATRAGSDGSMQRIARLVQSASADKAKIVRTADRWATWVVVGALVAAAGVFLITGEVLRAVTVLVVFCPCSLVLAIPTAIMAAIGNATKHGFLVKEGDALERLAGVQRVAFDKTGTLTEGEPHVVEVRALPDSPLDSDRLFSLIASAELRSEHPLGKAVVRSARSAGVAFDEPECFEMLPGRGVSAQVGGHTVAVGNVALMGEMGFPIGTWDNASISAFGNEGCTVALIGVDGDPCGMVALSDTLRPEASAMLGELAAENISPVLLTGDNAAAARAVASKMGISDVVASCRPEDKLSYIEGVEKSGCCIAMVGDGVNDAPALRRAYVGIAMGGVGSDIAIDAADIAIVDDGIRELSHLFSLSRHMMRVIKANLAFSMTLNFVAIVLAMVAVLDPVTGALVHNCGSVFVIVNSAFLLGWTSKKATI